MVAHVVWDHGAGGSSPSTSTNMVGIAQSVRAPDCGSGGREFESHYSPHILTH
ncbi:protein of unknown function [Tepidibacter aestuarii]|nr:protein of unknown function [Tepidibacter aestuarii]CAH2215285.1 protein of unknown function [Tepidibacter aestuarii]